MLDATVVRHSETRPHPRPLRVSREEEDKHPELRKCRAIAGQKPLCSTRGSREEGQKPWPGCGIYKNFPRNVSVQPRKMSRGHPAKEEL